MATRRGGLRQMTVNGEVYDVKGNVVLNDGHPLREPIEGADRMHGYMERPQAARAEVTLTDRAGLDKDALFNLQGVTIQFLLGTGETFTLPEAYTGGDGNYSTETGEISVTFFSDDQGTWG